MKSILQDYFEFSRTERNGSLSLIFCIAGIFFLPNIYPFLNQDDKEDFSDFKTIVAQLEVETIAEAKQKKTDYQSFSNNKFKSNFKSYTTKPSYKKTNSNYSEKTIPTQKQTNGKNKNSAITEAPFPKTNKEYFTNYKKEYPKKNFSKKEYSTPYIKKSTEQKIEINTANAETWQQLKGIGATYSARIVKFKNALGGFVTPQQVSEVYGLPDSTFQSILPQLVLNNNDVKRININTASIDDLKQHPYLKWKHANAIVVYRDQHGPYNSPDQINNLHSLPENLIKKIIPYLTTQ